MPPPRPTESATLRVGPSTLYVIKLVSRVWCLLKFETPCSKWDPKEWCIRATKATYQAMGTGARAYNKDQIFILIELVSSEGK